MSENEKGKKAARDKAQAKAETKAEDKGEAKAEVKAETPAEPQYPAAKVDLTALVDRTTERIVFLKKQQEDLARQKEELEELNNQRKELEKGRREVLVSLERALAVLQNEENDLQRRHSLVHATRNEFGKILKEVKDIREENWKKENIKEELSHGLAVVAKAQRDFRKAQGQIEAISFRDLDKGREVVSSAPASVEFLPESSGELFKRGLLFFLPAAILAILVVFILRLIAAL